MLNQPHLGWEWRIFQGEKKDQFRKCTRWSKESDKNMGKKKSTKLVVVWKVYHWLLKNKTKNKTLENFFKMTKRLVWVSHAHLDAHVWRKDNEFFIFIFIYLFEENEG